MVGWAVPRASLPLWSFVLGEARPGSHTRGCSEIPPSRVFPSKQVARPISAQWGEAINPRHVLIDGATGHVSKRLSLGMEEFQPFFLYLATYHTLGRSFCICDCVFLGFVNLSGTLSSDTPRLPSGLLRPVSLPEGSLRPPRRLPSLPAPSPRGFSHPSACLLLTRSSVDVFVSSCVSPAFRRTQ